MAPHFSLPNGIPSVDDLWVISGFIHLIKRGLQWRDAPSDYGRHKTLYNRFVRWSRMGVFDEIFADLAAGEAPPNNCRLTPPISKPIALRPAFLKRGCSPPYRPDQRRPELQTVSDGMDRPVVMLLSEGQMSDYNGARLFVNNLPLAKQLLADRSYDAVWFREALEGKGIKPCIWLKGKCARSRLDWRLRLLGRAIQWRDL